MKTRWIVTVTLTLVLAGSLPASAQMMGGQGGMMGMGMMDMMGRGMHEAAAPDGCPGMRAQPVAFGYEGPWISFALAHTKDLELTADQMKALTTLRDEFQKEAAQRTQDIRAGEIALAALYRPKAPDLTAIEAKIKEIAAREAELRIVRMKTLQKGLALLTDTQREKLLDTSRTMGRMMGAFLTPPGSEQ